MIDEAPPVAGPYTHAGASVRRTMGLVLLALLPALLFGLYAFGWPAIFLLVITLLTAVLAEALS
ncbi:MAG TPA: RnfABCDGE type electron transport complex subunit D, partial [Gammaproteobacteria bacterium]|nr:RnfABCDGE type electron transport complex subunit D [Gammaproteobacteria bacterium]